MIISVLVFSDQKENEFPATNSKLWDKSVDAVENLNTLHYSGASL